MTGRGRLVGVGSHPVWRVWLPGWVWWMLVGRYFFFLRWVVCNTVPLGLGAAVPPRCWREVRLRDRFRSSLLTLMFRAAVRLS